MRVVSLDQLICNVEVGGGVPDDRGSVGTALENRCVTMLLRICLQEGVEFLRNLLKDLLRLALRIVFEVFGLALKLPFFPVQ